MWAISKEIEAAAAHPGLCETVLSAPVLGSSECGPSVCLLDDFYQMCSRLSSVLSVWIFPPSAGLWDPPWPGRNGCPSLHWPYRPSWDRPSVDQSVSFPLKLTPVYKPLLWWSVFPGFGVGCCLHCVCVLMCVLVSVWACTCHSVHESQRTTLLVGKSLYPLSHLAGQI
jgi:hypothetical protein